MYLLTLRMAVVTDCVLIQKMGKFILAKLIMQARKLEMDMYLLRGQSLDYIRIMN